MLYTAGEIIYINRMAYFTSIITNIKSALGGACQSYSVPRSRLNFSLSDFWIFPSNSHKPRHLSRFPPSLLHWENRSHRWDLPSEPWIFPIAAPTFPSKGELSVHPFTPSHGPPFLRVPSVSYILVGPPSGLFPSSYTHDLLSPIFKRDSLHSTFLPATLCFCLGKIQVLEITLSIIPTFSTSIFFSTHHHMTFWPCYSTKTFCKRYR